MLFEPDRAEKVVRLANESRLAGGNQVNLARIGLIIVAIVAALVAVYALFRAFDERSAPPIVIEDAAVDLPLIVDIRGAVNSEGVYELPPGARVQDGLNAAGGLAPDADLSTINLARRLRDGEVLVIARLGAGPGTPSSLVVDGSESSEGASRININTASVNELDLLPGIGEVTAQRIVEFREQNGPYRSIDDLVLVQGISSRMVSDLRPLITVGP
jgi:competence protein ComEA